ncbi:MAG TPA: MarP family serine protease [Solirubrobacteraceae bacterium]
MTGLDWIIFAFAGLLGLFGFRQGFIVGALSFGGFAIGAFLGTRLGPLLLARGFDSPYAPAFGLIGALLAGAILAAGLEGLGWRLRRSTRLIPGAGVLDRSLGALLSAAVALGIVWIAAAVVAQIPGQSQLRADIQRSAILRELNQLLPPSGPVLGALARLDPIPQIAGVTLGVPPPLPRSVDTAGVRAAERSVVRVLGTACGLAIEGSGWVAGPDVVVTNAHVIAGEQDTTVEVGGGQPILPAQAIAFDPTDDVAVLRVPDLGLPALAPVSNPAAGMAGAILGYPENGPFDAQPARIGQSADVITENAYGEGPISRLLTPLRGLVRPGNSGGPVVDGSGRVLTTVFAGTTGGGPHGGYGVANATVTHVLAGATAPVATGHCVE